MHEEIERLAQLTEGDYDLDSISPSDAEELADLIEEYGFEPVKAYVEDVGLECALESFEEAYQGEWGTEAEFASEIADAMGWTDAMKEAGISPYYFDSESFARDLFMGDYTFHNGHVFLNM